MGFRNQTNAVKFSAHTEIDFRQGRPICKKGKIFKINFREIKNLTVLLEPIK